MNQLPGTGQSARGLPEAFQLRAWTRVGCQKPGFLLGSGKGVPQQSKRGVAAQPSTLARAERWEGTAPAPDVPKCSGKGVTASQNHPGWKRSPKPSSPACEPSPPRHTHPLIPWTPPGWGLQNSLGSPWTTLSMEKLLQELQMGTDRLERAQTFIRAFLRARTFLATVAMQSTYTYPNHL